MERNPDATARKTAEKALARLAADLGAGRSEALTNYLDAMSRFRERSWENVLLIAVQRPEATHVAGIHDWNDVGRAVKAGEKGILIFTPVAARRATYVFDVSQTEGKPLPEFARPPVDPTQYEKRLRALIADRGINGVQAQAVTYVVARGLGLHTDNTAADYSALYNGDSKALARSLTAIQNASTQILDDLLPEERTRSRPVAAAHQRQSQFQRNAEGFDQLHREYSDRLVQSMTGFVKDQNKAEDIAARTFQAAWEKRDRFRGEALPYTYLQAIARNEARQLWNREQIVQVDSMDGAPRRDVAAPELVTDELEKQEDRDRVKRALAQLPSKSRRALVAHFVEGLSIREVARHERVPLGTVLSRIHRGKQMLRDAWEAGEKQGSRSWRAESDQRPTTESRDAAAWDR